MSSKTAKKLDTPTPRFTVEQLRPNIHKINIPYTRLKDWEQWILVTSDRHWDNPKSDREKQRKHLREADERGACVIDLGDWFCAMQGRYDPRRSLKEIRPEHNVPEYLNALSDTAAEWFKPYAHLFAVIGRGNHETSVHKNCGYDLTQSLVRDLQAAGSKCTAGGYAGWIRFMFQRIGSSRENGTPFTLPLQLYYHHGYGGDSPVTRGVIQTARMGLYIPDAHIVITGHTHNEWQMNIGRIRLSQSGKQYTDSQLHIKVPSYKDDFGTGEGGWHVERGGPPKTIGAVWIRFFYSQEDGSDRIKYEAIRAQ